MPTSEKNLTTTQAPAAEGQDYGLVSSYDLHLFNEGTHTRLYEKFGSHVTEIERQAGHLLRRLGARCDAHLRRRRFQQLESRCHAHELQGQLRCVGGLRSRAGQGRHLQILYPLALSRLFRRQGRPLRLPLRDAAQDRVHRVGHLVRVAGLRVDEHAQAEERLRRAHLHLRSPPRLMDARPRGSAIARSIIASWRTSWAIT